MNTSQKLLVSLILGASVCMTGLVSANYGGDGHNDNEDGNNSHNEHHDYQDDNGTGDHEDNGSTGHNEDRQHIRDNWEQMKHNREDMKEEIHSNRQSFESEQGHVKQFFRTGLNDQEKLAIKGIIEKFQADREALFATMKVDQKSGGIANTGTYNTLFADLRTTYYTALKVYVDPAKVDAYNAFVADRNAMVIKNMDTREETWDANKELHDDNKEIKSSRWDSMKQKFTQMSQERLTIIANKIDSIKASINNSAVASLLDDLKAYIGTLLQ